MKRKTTYLKSLLVSSLLILGGVNSWADDVYTEVYSRATVDAWTNDDVTDWGGSSNLSVDGTNGLGFNVNMYSTTTGLTASKSFSTISSNSKIKYEFTWYFGSAINNSGSYAFVRFGNFVLRWWNNGYSTSFSVNGSDFTVFNAGCTSNSTYTKDVEIILNTASGVVEKFSFGGTDFTSSVTGTTSGTMSDVSFGYVRGGRAGNWTYPNYLKTFKVSECKQVVANADYTINYIFGGETIKTVEGTSVVGATVNAESPIIISDQRYYAADDATTSVVLAAGSNVLDVTLRKAYTGTVNINAVDGELNVLKTFSAERTEGDAASNLFYTRVVKYNDKYYKVVAANGNVVNYGRSMAYGASDVNITYTLDEYITYYAEESELNKSRSFAAQGQVPERASGGNWQRLYANSQVWTAALPAGIYSFDVSGRNQGSNTGNLAVKVRLSNGTFIDANETFSLNNSQCAVQSFTGIEVPEGASIALAETTGNNSNIGLDYVIAYKTADAPTTVSVTVSDAGMATYVSSMYDLDFSATDIKAYKAKVSTKGKCTLTQVEKVPVGTPVLLVKEGGATEDIPVTTGAATLSDNDLVAGAGANVATTDGDYTNMILNNVNGNIGFYFANDQMVATNRAYLHILTSLAPDAVYGARMQIVFDNETNGIKSVNNALNESGNYFNLSGQRISEPAKGLYIVNGKKVIIK